MSRLSINRFIAGALLIFTLLFSACLQEKNLVTSLTEPESREILVELRKFGVNAERVKDASRIKGSLYKIRVRDEKYHLALSILDVLKLPKNKRESKDQTRFSKLNLSRADREKGQYEERLGQNLEELLESYPGIVEAKAFVLTPKEVSSELQENPKIKPFKASIFIRYLADRLPPALVKAKDGESAPRENILNKSKLKEIALNYLPDESISFNPSTVNLEATKIEISKELIDTNLELVSASPFSIFISKIKSDLPFTLLIASITAFLFTSLSFLLGMFTDRNKPGQAKSSMGGDFPYLVDGKARNYKIKNLEDDSEQTHENNNHEQKNISNL